MLILHRITVLIWPKLQLDPKMSDSFGERATTPAIQDLTWQKGDTHIMDNNGGNYIIQVVQIQVEELELAAIITLERNEQREVQAITYLSLQSMLTS